MDSAADVLFALTGDPRTNSRALRQLDVLARLGLDVCVLGYGPPDLAAPDFPGRLVLLDRPEGRGPRFFWRSHRRFRAAATRRPARIYHASDLYTLPALADAARRHGAGLVYDARELYPHVASTSGRPWARAVWQAVEGRFIRRTDAVFTVSESIAGRISETSGLPRPAVIYNTPPRQHVDPSDVLRRRIGLGPERVLVLHQGQMRPDRGCTRLVEAVRDVPRAALVFMGDGPLRPELAALAHACGVADRVFFLDPVPAELLRHTASADVGVTLLEDTCLNHRFALPNKLFEYLTAGVPVLGSDLPEVRRVVRGHDVGLVADASDHASVVEALRRMVEDPAARAAWARNAPRVFETYDPARSLERFADVYRSLLAPCRS